MRRCVTLLLVLAALPVSAGPAWRWVDANGTVHYSDRPVPGAEEVYLPDGSGPAAARPEAEAATPPPAPAASADIVPDTESLSYSRLAITSPAQDETLWNIGGILTVVVDISPRLQRGHRLILLYDGERQSASPASDLSFSLSEVYRGLHTVQAVILDSSNTPVLESLPVQFMVQQTSILNPARN